MRSVPLVLLSLLSISLPALAEETEFPLESGNYAYTSPISQRTVFVIENASGSIEIVPTSGMLVRMSGNYRGAQPAKLRFSQVEPGKVKIAVEHPGQPASGNVTGSRGVYATDNSIIRNVIVVGRNNVVSNNYVSGGSSDRVSRIDTEAGLKVEIPSHLLGSIRVETKEGPVSISGFAEPASAAGRKVILQSGRGDVRVANMLAPAGIEVAAGQGEVVSTCNTACSFTLKSGLGGAQAVSNSIDLFTLRLGAGEIVARDNAGDIDARTGMGNVTVSGQRGAVDARTAMGRIEFDNPEATSESGSSAMGGVSYTRRGHPAKTARECGMGMTRDEFDF
jgi:hypothetical protein